MERKWLVDSADVVCEVADKPDSKLQSPWCGGYAA